MSILIDNRNVIGRVGCALVGDISTILSEVVTDSGQLNAEASDNMYLNFFSLMQMLVGSQLRKYKFVHDAF